MKYKNTITIFVTVAIAIVWNWVVATYLPRTPVMIGDVGLVVGLAVFMFEMNRSNN